MPRNKPHVLTEIPTYDGPAVYALIDDVGRPYVGSTNDFQRRMKAWETNFRSVLFTGQPSGLVPNSVSAALLAGRSFRAVVVEALPAGLSQSDRVARERAALSAYGGVNMTYNAMVPACKGWRSRQDSPAED